MIKNIGELELADFDGAAIWASRLDGCDEESVEPRPELASLPEGVHGLWVRFHGSLNDGTRVAGIAMATSSPPSFRLHSFSIEDKWMSVTFPPAPDFVLAEDGPERFARRLERPLSSVFPINITSDVTVETTGKHITQILQVNGPVV